MLLEGIDTSFLDKIADMIPDWRNQDLILHPLREMIRQRVGQIACGYEDANDCDTLRRDSAVKIYLLGINTPYTRGCCIRPSGSCPPMFCSTLLHTYKPLRGSPSQCSSELEKLELLISFFHFAFASRI